MQKVCNTKLYCAKRMINQALQRVKRQNLAFNITYHSLLLYLNKHDFCMCCGVKFQYHNNHHNKQTSPSLDRYIPEKGYIFGNINIICWQCNNIKCNSNLKNLEKIKYWMLLDSMEKIIKISSYKLINKVTKHIYYDRAHNLRSAMIDRAKKNNIKYDPNYFSTRFLLNCLLQYKNCPCCKEHFYLGCGINPHSHSLDRIDNNKGYIKENVSLICKQCNTLKKGYSIQEINNIIVYLEHKIQNNLIYEISK